MIKIRFFADKKSCLQRCFFSQLHMACITVSWIIFCNIQTSEHDKNYPASQSSFSGYHTPVWESKSRLTKTQHPKFFASLI